MSHKISSGLCEDIHSNYRGKINSFALTDSEMRSQICSLCHYRTHGKMQTKSIKNSQNKDIHIYQIPLFVDSYFLNTQTIIIAFESC